MLPLKGIVASGILSFDDAVDAIKPLVPPYVTDNTIPTTSETLTLSDRLPLAVQARYQFFLSNKIVCMKVCCQSI